METQGKTKLPRFNAYLEEECRLNLVKAIVDSACSIIKIGTYNQEESDSYRLRIKSIVMQFLPGEEAKYDMIYDSRLKRYIEQFSTK